MKKILLLLTLISLWNCKENISETPSSEINEIVSKAPTITHAKGFSIYNYEDYKIIKVNSPWPKAEQSFTYLLAEEKANIPDNVNYDEKVTIPIKSLVVTSTTHIPALESLGEEESLVGFPNLSYISSEKTRKRIADGNIKELGKNESINTEVLIDLQPDVVIGFAVESGNKTFETIKKTGIPVVYNGDWTEADPLGKAEWIKFFGAFFNKEKQADSIFTHIKKEFLEAKELANKTTEAPSVLAGSMYKDVWYLPYGNSWQAKFIKDANAKYLYADTNGDGSISAAFESVLEKAQDADYWIAPGSFTSYDQLVDASKHYQEFKAFQQKKIYSFAGVTGETGGVLYYELAPHRPDLVLKDLIKIFHPKELPNYKTTFFKPLD
jgi:iron complex transport system substrate-binding protein